MTVISLPRSLLLQVGGLSQSFLRFLVSPFLFPSLVLAMESLSRPSWIWFYKWLSRRCGQNDGDLANTMLIFQASPLIRFFLFP